MYDTYTDWACFFFLAQSNREPGCSCMDPSNLEPMFSRGDDGFADREKT